MRKWALSWAQYRRRDSNNTTATETWPPGQSTYIATSAGEDLERYREGGFHPVHIGDRIHDRYQVSHKLGFGAFSTV